MRSVITYQNHILRGCVYWYSDYIMQLVKFVSKYSEPVVICVRNRKKWKTSVPITQLLFIQFSLHCVVESIALISARFVWRLLYSKRKGLDKMLDPNYLKIMVFDRVLLVPVQNFITLSPLNFEALKDSIFERFPKFREFYLDIFYNGLYFVILCHRNLNLNSYRI